MKINFLPLVLRLVKEVVVEINTKNNVKTDRIFHILRSYQIQTLKNT